MLLVNIRGLGVGRWVAHFGTTVILLVAVLMVALLFIHPAASVTHPHVAPQPPFLLVFPAITIASLNLFGKLSFNGLSGLEQVAVFAGETRGPDKTILRSAWIAAPIIGLTYILMTGSILEYTAADKVDLIGPIQQLMATAFGNQAGTALGAGLLLGRLAILAIAAALIAQYTVILAATSRLPMVAAWDHLMPGWFMKLHPRFRTPTRSLTVISAIAVVLALLASIGAGAQETFQVLATAGNLCYAINYLLMFAVPLAVGSRFGVAPGIGLRAACVAGAGVTLLSILVSLLPIVDVKDVGIYACKVGLAALLLNALGIALYWRGKRSARRSS
jgi:amino acid transporter